MPHEGFTFLTWPALVPGALWTVVDNIDPAPEASTCYHLGTCGKQPYCSVTSSRVGASVLAAFPWGDTGICWSFLGPQCHFAWALSYGVSATPEEATSMCLSSSSLKQILCTPCILSAFWKSRKYPPNWLKICLAVCIWARNRQTYPHFHLLMWIFLFWYRKWSRPNNWNRLWVQFYGFSCSPGL